MVNKTKIAHKSRMKFETRLNPNPKIAKKLIFSNFWYHTIFEMFFLRGIHLWYSYLCYYTKKIWKDRSDDQASLTVDLACNRVLF